ncbi:MAG: hypothetical protein FWD16_04470, partial [Clostridia bacterium]|nr:hypothetical protein [Clostridia bacterium]
RVATKDGKPVGPSAGNQMMCKVGTGDNLVLMVTERTSADGYDWHRVYANGKQGWAASNFFSEIKWRALTKALLFRRN